MEYEPACDECSFAVFSIRPDCRAEPLLHDSGAGLADASRLYRTEIFDILEVFRNDLPSVVRRLGRRLCPFSGETTARKRSRRRTFVCGWVPNCEPVHDRTVRASIIAENCERDRLCGLSVQ